MSGFGTVGSGGGGGGAPSGPAGGDLGGTYPNPTVLALTASGPTQLTLGTIADGEFLQRSGATIVGAAASTTITDAYVAGGGDLTLNATQNALRIAGDALAAGTSGQAGPDYFAINRGATPVVRVAYNATDGRAALYSGATGGLDLAPTPIASVVSPTLSVLTNKLLIFRGDRSFSSGYPIRPIEWASTLTLSGTNPTLGGFITLGGTMQFASSANAFGMGNALIHEATWKNSNGVSANLGPCFLFVNNGVFQADGASISMSQMRTFFDNPTYNTINGGTFSMAATIGHVSLYSSMTVNSGATIGLRRGLAFFDATGTGALTTQVVVDIPNLTFGGTNVGIRSAMTAAGGTFISHTGNAAARFGGEVEIDGALNHDGTTVGFYNVAPVARPAAYTQTFSTASRTHAALTSATLTDLTGGTANTTVAAVSGSGADATINDNFADIIAQVNALRVDLSNAKQVLNSVIDDHQANGLLQ